MNHRLTVLTLALLTMTSCRGVGPRTDAPGTDRLLTLRDTLAGSFSSEAQAAADADFYHIVLHATPMWTWRDDGPWLYVEQAVAESADEPYRQRVYKLEPVGDGTYRSRVFVFEEPLRFAGAWKTASPLADLSPADLEERVGCAITLTWNDTARAFTGSTAGSGCASDLRGAAYATSEVTLESNRLTTWDRGYDAEGEQVWGTTKGGYTFERMD